MLTKREVLSLKVAKSGVALNQDVPMLAKFVRNCRVAIPVSLGFALAVKGAFEDDLVSNEVVLYFDMLQVSRWKQMKKE